MMNAFDKYVGQVFDNRYKITKVLGVGGMAVVFEAFDTKLNRIVALKMLKDEIANDSQSVKRFINESKAVSMLAHPNIVSIYDVSVKDNLKYIVMERVDGITLKSYMTQKGVLSLAETLSYAEQILRALEHAHSKGIIHRDIKPQNIMLLKNGRIKVTDFGIAKLPNAETVTMTDKAIGTVFYISPEQASGKAIDQRSDLYSLGVLMYEMATGQLPFNAESPVSVALMQVNAKAKAPREIMPNIPLGLEQIIMLAMEKQPERRFQNAAQMLRHLIQIKNNPTYVFKTKSRDGKIAIEDVEKSKGADQTPGRVSRPMFPMIMGISLAFLLVFGFVVIHMCTWFGLFNWADILSFGKDADPEEEIEELNNSETVSVPNLMGKVITQEFRDELEAQGFKLTLKYDDSQPDVAVNTVLGQFPEAGAERKIIPGQQYCDIKLTLSRGKDAKVLPDLTVKDYREVEIKLSDMGLKFEEKYEVNDNIPVGCIIRTVPMAGEKVNAGDTIVLYISKGTDVKYVQVPNFVGLTEAQAKAQLADYNLVLGEITYEQSSKPAGTVIGQSRAAYESVPEKTTKIDLVISKGQ
ncbi:MAG: Stk1 family PASTA domain-containing Ser/Thr kinase [Clostridia bacterium]|nr:Stk1 family PASTA domain-containing Ser/Thr kinase [Clostridia bacterium]